MIVAFGGEVNSTDGYINRAGSSDFGAVLLLAHGAGAPADSPFMELLARRLADQGITVVRFEFPYMVKRREDGRKRPPDRAEKLLDAFAATIDKVSADLAPGQTLFIGGKSMGGRMASLLAADERLKGKFRGVVCFGYPFHPPGKLDKWRTAHFEQLWCPVSIQQGTRDPFGKPDEVAGQGVFEQVAIDWLEGGNHDFLPPKKLEQTQESLVALSAANTAAFLKQLL